MTSNSLPFGYFEWTPMEKAVSDIVTDFDTQLEDAYKKAHPHTIKMIMRKLRKAL